MPAKLSLPSERVCFVLLSGLGDVVHGLPIVNALKRDSSDRRITWVVEPMPSRILENHPAVDDVILFEPRRGLAGIGELRNQLHGRRFDVTLNLNVYTKSVWPVLLSGAPNRLGFDRRRTHEGVWLASNRHLVPGPRRHTQDMFLEFLDSLGVARPDPIEWRITFTEEEQRAQSDFFERMADRPVTVIVPASGSYKKDWIAERWAAVANALYADFSYHVVLAGGPGERETQIARDIEKRSTAPIVWAMGDGVRRVAGIVSRANLLIAPDTGPVHIARAFGVPVVGLYGHTNPWRVGPYRAFEDLWIDRYTNSSDQPDASRADARWERMPMITVDDVLDRIERARSSYGSLTRSS